MKIAIVGAGSWGTAIGILLAKKGYDISLWDRKKELIDEINNTHENIFYLPGVIIPSNALPTNSIEECINGAKIIVMAVSSHAVRDVGNFIKPFVNKEQIFVNLAKGIENITFKRMSEILEEIFPDNKITVLSGPSHAEEVSRDIPTTVVVSSKCQEASEYIQDVFITPKFRVYTNPDIIGVELGGAIKNIIALAAGICDGLGYGDNTKAALMTRGIVEIARLGVKLGAQPLTFAGLSGIGDLIVTCTSMHSRNRRAGILIGQGKTVDEAVKEVKMVVEGINATKSTYALSHKVGVEMPITNEIYLILFEGKDPKYAVSDLMLRNKKHEIEEVVQKMW